MNRRAVLAVTGRLFMSVAALLCAPALFGLIDGDAGAASAYGAAAVVTAAFAALVWRIGGAVPADLHRKDAFGIVALAWLGLGIFGALPFLFEGSIPDVAGAVFEAVSGFTTTGATVVADVDGLSRATNLWRCLMHWVGGMGIVVLFVAVFPMLGVGAKQLFKTEVAGPTVEGLRPRIKETATALWWIYSGLTLLCAGLLWLLGMSPFDAACHAMSTLGTGGFSTYTASVGHFESAAIEWVICVFMFLAGTNFALFYGAARGRWRDLFRNAELRFYLAVNVAVVAVVAVAIADRHADLHGAVRGAVFQVLAVTTTTGFMTEDFDTYPHVARYLLLLCMFMGGCAGSTAGGIKAIRVLMLPRLFSRELVTTVQPQAVVAVRLGDQVVSPSVLSSVTTYILCFGALFAGVSALMIALGLDLVTGMSATVACLSSIGPGLEGVGPSQNFGAIPGIGKALLSFCMIAGRLEIFALFAVFTPECWRR